MWAFMWVCRGKEVTLQLNCVTLEDGEGIFLSSSDKLKTTYGYCKTF